MNIIQMWIDGIKLIIKQQKFDLPLLSYLYKNFTEHGNHILGNYFLNSPFFKKFIYHISVKNVLNFSCSLVILSWLVWCFSLMEHSKRYVIADITLSWWSILQHNSYKSQCFEQLLVYVYPTKYMFNIELHNEKWCLVMFNYFWFYNAYRDWEWY